MLQKVKPWFGTQAFHTGVPVWVLVALLLLELPANTPGK